MRAFFCSIVLGIVIGSCQMGQPASSAADGDKAEPTDAELRQRYGDETAADVADIRAKHDAALAAPNSLDAADAYADALLDGMKKNYTQIKGIDWLAYVKDGSDVLESATSGEVGDAEKAANALVKRAMLLTTLRKTTQAEMAVRTGFGKARTYMTSMAMIGVHLHNGREKEAAPLCGETRALAKTDDEVFSLIDTCMRLNRGEPPEETLPWVSASEWEMYKQRAQERGEQNLARREAEDAIKPPPPPPAQPAGAAEGSQPAAGPKRASFTLRNSCRETVKLFFGKTPKFGSGRTDSMSGNSMRNESMTEGEMIWIVDGSGNGMSSHTVSSGVREVIIDASCKGFQSR